MKKFYAWWADNIYRPSTWGGIFLFILVYVISQDEQLITKLVGNIIDNPSFIQMIVGAISGALIIHKRDVDKK